MKRNLNPTCVSKLRGEKDRREGSMWRDEKIKSEKFKLLADFNRSQTDVTNTRVRYLLTNLYLTVQ